jgi:hypothetical protein
MTDVEVRLNENQKFSQNRGEMAPDDPHYHVCYWQGEQVKVTRKGKVVKAWINLPFDSEGNIVPDDGRKEPWAGKDSDNKPVTHYPLWTDDMRTLLAKKQKELAERTEDEKDDIDPDWAASRINWVGWLKGTENYNQWHILQAGAKKTFGKVFNAKKDMVTELVLEHGIVPPEQLCKEFQKMLPHGQGADA